MTIISRQFFDGYISLWRSLYKLEKTKIIEKIHNVAKGFRMKNGILFANHKT
jgi:hypothetical protein